MTKLRYSLLLLLLTLFISGAHSTYAQSSVYVAAKKKFKENIGANITAVYQKKLNAINIQKEGHKKLVYELQIEWQQLQNQLDAMAEDYAANDFDGLDEKERKAYNLFEEGKYEESINLRESFGSEKSYTKALKESKKREAESLKSGNIDNSGDEVLAFHKRNLSQLAKEQLLQFDFDKARKTLEFLASVDETDFNSNYDFAYFLENQNQVRQAIQYYQRALESAMSEGETANVKNHLGTMYKAENDLPVASNAYTAALEIYQRLVETDSANYEPKVAMTLNNLGVVYQAQYDYYSAFEAYGKALDIYERLVTTNPVSCEPELAMTQNYLGYLYADKREFSAAFDAYNKALEMYVQLAKTNPATYNSYVAKTQNNLGILYQTNDNFPEALNAYGKALEIYEQLAKNNPAVYEADVARTQNNFGVLYKSKNNFPEAINCFNKSQEILKRLLKYDPDSLTYQSDLASTLINLGASYYSKKDHETAMNNFNKALEIYEQLAATNPLIYDACVGTALNDLGILYSDINDFHAALNTYSKAIKIYESLAEAHPVSFDLELCRCIVLLGYLQKSHYEADRQPEVEQYLNRARQILPDYTERTPFAKLLLSYVDELLAYFDNYEYLQSVEALKNQVKGLEKYSEKIVIQQKIIDSYAFLMNKGYPEFVDNLENSMGDLAWYLLFEKQFSEAENVAKEALNPANYAKTEDYDKKVEWVNTNLALALLFQGKYTEAAKIYLTFKDKFTKNSTYKEVFLSDLDTLEKAGITHPDVAKIRAVLNN